MLLTEWGIHYRSLNAQCHHKHHQEYYKPKQVQQMTLKQVRGNMTLLWDWLVMKKVEKRSSLVKGKVILALTTMLITWLALYVIALGSSLILYPKSTTQTVLPVSSDWTVKRTM